ncbi:MAG: hypothetical protein AAFO82_15230 [Bacteroidota bacterium]
MEKNYNEIDDFFKKAFEKEEHSDEGWNAPSDSVWEKLSTPENNKRPLFMYWRWTAIAAAIILLLIAGQFLYQQRQLQKQSEKIEQLEKQLKDQASNHLKPTLNFDKEIAITNDNFSITEIESSSDKKEKITALPPQKSAATTSKEHSSKQQVATGTERDDHPLESPLTSVESIPERDEISTILPLNSPTNLLEKSTPNLNMPKLLHIETVKTKPSYLTTNYAITESAQAFDHRRIQSFRRSNVIKEQNLNLGLRYTHFLDKNWFIESGVHYSKSTAERRHLLRSRFQKNEERPGSNDNFESTHNLSLFSSAYELETDVVLSRSSNSNNTILDGRNLRLVGVVTNELQRLSIPMLIGHQLKYQRWNWTLKAGLIPNVKLVDEVRLDRILSSDSEFMVQSIADTKRRSNQQGISMDWYFYAGSALSYQVSDTWALQLEPFFSRSLSAQPGLQNNTVFNHSTGIHVGLRYSL